MKRRITVFTVVFAVSILIGIQAVETADADPFFIFHQVDPVPGTIPATITIFSPQNNQTYHSDRIIISFNVSKPQLGNNCTAIIDVKYTLDKDTTEAFSIWRGGSASNANAVPEFDTVFTSPSLSTGNHQLTVVAEGVVYLGNLSIFFIDSASAVYFTMGDQTAQLSPIPSQVSTPNPTQVSETIPTPNNPSSPSMGPAPTSNQTLTSNYLNPTFVIIIVGVIVIVAVASLSLIYFKKREANTELVKLPLKRNL
jgi:hypothetical protein